MKRYIILIVVCLGLFKLFTTRQIDIRVHQICPIVQTSETISGKEAQLFLEQWQEYKNRGYMKKVPENFAFDEVEAMNRLPWLVKLWMDKNCIDPKRFYYTEQRLRTILKAYDMQKHTQGVIAILSEQMTQDMDQSKRAWYESLIEEQKQMAKVEGVLAEELKIVDGRTDEIQMLLDDVEASDMQNK